MSCNLPSESKFLQSIPAFLDQSIAFLVSSCFTTIMSAADRDVGVLTLASTSSAASVSPLPEEMNAIGNCDFRSCAQFSRFFVEQIRLVQLTMRQRSYAPN